jgi:hypothetical protein
MTRDRAWQWAWFGCVAHAFVACGTPDNGGVEISFGPASVSSTAPFGSIGDAESSGDGDAESSSTTEDPPAPTTAPPPPDPTDWEEMTESSSDGGEESSSGGDAAMIECTGLDAITCAATFGCAWPEGDEIFGMGDGPCGWDRAACLSLDQFECLTSPACTLMQGEQNFVCTGVTCEVLDQVTCPMVAGCLWYVDPNAGGFCLGPGFG